MAGLSATLQIDAVDNSAKAIDAFKNRVKSLDQFVAQRDPFMALADKVTTATDRMAKSLTDSERAFSAQRDAISEQAEAMQRLLEPTTAVARAQAEMAGGMRESTRALEAQSAAAGHTAQRLAAAHKEAMTFSRVMGDALPFAGPAILGASVRGIETGATVEERIAQLKSAGSTDDQIARARADFRDFSRGHAGVLESDYLGGYKDARVIAPGEAFEMAKHGAVFRSALRNSGLPVNEGDVGDALRTMDELGLKTDSERADFLNQILKTEQTFGTQVPVSTILAAVRNSKQSVYKMSPDFLNKYLPTILQSAGQNGGTEIMTAYSNYIGQHMQHAEMVALARAGFIDPNSLQYDKTGKVKGVKPGAKFFEEDTFKSNIAQWSWDMHDKFMSRQGATEDQFDSLVAKMPRNMGALVSFLAANENRIKRDADTREHAIGDKAADNDSLAANPIAGLAALRDAIAQFSAVVTEPTMKEIGGALTSTAQGLQALAAAYGDFAKSHSDAAKALGFGAEVTGVGVGGYLSAKLLGNFGKLLFGGGAAGSEGAAAAGVGAGGVVMGVLGRLGILGAVAGLTEYLDPAGNFGGLTTPVDQWFKKTLGIDPSNVSLGPTKSSYIRGTADLQDELDAQRANYRAGYTDRELAAELQREGSRGRGLSRDGGESSVSVSGKADVTQHVDVDVHSSPELLATVRSIRDFAFSIGLHGGKDVGRMDSDAAPISRGNWDR